MFAILTVDSRCLEFGYLEQPLISKYLNLTSGNKRLSIRGEIAPREQFLPFSTIFLIYISKQRRLIAYSFVKFGCAICISLNSENLICRTTDISKCFRGSLQLRDNESRLYIHETEIDYTVVIVVIAVDACNCC